MSRYFAREDSNKEQLNATDGFRAATEALAEQVSEIAENYEDIEAMGQTLIERHAIEADFFDSQARTLLFTAIAARAHEAEMNTSDMSPEELEREHQFIDDITLLLTTDYAPPYEGAPGSVEDDPFTQLLSIDPRMVDQEATRALQVAIDQNGLLDAERQELGITEAEESPFILRVLSSEITDPELQQDVETLMGADVSLFEEAAAYYEGGVVSHDGTTYLTIGSHTAKEILAGNTIVLRHEYIHTQRGYRVTESGVGGIGRSFEERRAMLFSNDGVGVGAQYEDVNGLFEALDMVTGVDVDEYIRQNPTDPDELYMQIANAIGLQSTLELSAASSTQFTPQEAGIEREVYLYLGGLQE